MNNSIFSKVFMWLFIGLLVTFALGYGLELFFINHLDVAKMVFSGAGFWIIIIAEIVLAVLLGARLAKMSSITAKVLYLLYCGLTGVMFSTIFMRFELTSIIFIFLVTAVIFGIFAFIGSNLNVDLTKFGIYLIIALIGSLIVGIINIFIGSSTLNLVLSIVSIVIFTLYIGYDIRRIDVLSNGDIDEDKVAVYGAFQLYLDFINIFIRLLELFGVSNSKD